MTAFFFVPSVCAGDIFDGPKCKDYAIGAHRTFLASFGLSASDVPLLRFDPSNWTTPFEEYHD